jgi:phosphoglycerate kinase
VLSYPGGKGLLLPTLEDLPEPSGKNVLVRATSAVPLGSAAAVRGAVSNLPGRDLPALSVPMAVRRAEGLASTLDWLAARRARVSVLGDAGDDESNRMLSEVVGTRGDTIVGVDEDPGLVDALIARHDLFVNDCFQTSYLPLPSLVRPPRRLPCAAGRTLQADLEALRPLVDPVRPFVAVLGGDRSYLRLHGLRGLVLRADTVAVGGKMAIPFLEATGHLPRPTGNAEDFLTECRGVFGLSRRVGYGIHLPEDLVWEGGEVVDIGELARLRFAEVVEGAGSVLWLGALGKVEEHPEGTRAVAAKLSRKGRHVVIGGDALVGVLEASGGLLEEVFTVSATDSALELIKNGTLPALDALSAGS